MSNATVSVLLPVRDPAPRTFAIALKSTLRSRLPAGVDLDVVVVDHGSIVDVAGFDVCDDARVRVVRVDRDASFAAALDVGRAACAGEFIARMDGDDVMHPLRLAEQRETLRSSDVAAVATRTKVIPRAVMQMRSYVQWQNSVLSPTDHQRDAWIELPVCHPSLMFRRNVLDDVGGYRDVPWPEDYDLYLRLICAGYAVIKRPEIRHAWRQHTGQVTRTRPATQSRDAISRCKAHHLVRRFDLAHRRVVVVGSGREGRRMSRALREEGVRVAVFLDKDPQKIGRVCHDVVVDDASAFVGGDDDFYVGCVGTSGARGAVRGFLKDRGVVEGVDGVVTA